MTPSSKKIQIKKRKDKKMTKESIIEIIVGDFTKRLIEAADHVIYSLYSEYLAKQAEEKKGEVTDET